MTTNRRAFLRQLAAATTGTLAWPHAATAIAAAKAKPLKVAAVITEFTYRSHAHVILENFLKPYLFNGQWTESGCDISSLYVDQFPEGEMARQVGREFGIPIYPTIGEALCLGSDRLGVDAVLSIGEHGKYPVNEKGQMEYPRKQFFDQIVAVFRRSDRVVPVFTDKHLSYRWDWAKEMYDTARSMGFPLMAGSSVPLAQRRPPLELPADAVLTDAVSIHGGGVESYDFHALDVLQSQVEWRRGGETGAAQVQFLDTDALWKAADAGHWSPELAQLAMAREVGPEHELALAMARRGKTAAGQNVPMHGILVRYRDGLPAVAMSVGGSGTRWNFACRLQGKSEPMSTSYYVGPWQNRNLFKALSHAIQYLFREGKEPYPVERTLLSTGILSAAMDSRHQGGIPLETPHLDIAYQPIDFRAMREMGASWKIITEDMPQPPGIDPGGKPNAG